MFANIFKENYKLLVLGLILLLGVFIYSNTLYSPFCFDDTKFIINNPVIRNLNLHTIGAAFPTRFFVLISLALNYHFSQLNVLGYHLFNLVVHLGTAILVWWFILLIFSAPVMKKDKLFKGAKLISLFAALIFLSHPLQTESVTYIWQRSTSLAGFFYLFSVCLYMKSRLLQIVGRRFPDWFLFYIFSFVFAVVSMFTKESTITLPAAIILCEFCFLKTDQRSRFKYAVPFLFLLPILPAMLISYHSYSLNNGWQYFLTQSKVMVNYIRLAFIPWPQNLDYDYPLAKSLLDLSVLSSFVFLGGIIIGAGRIFSKYRIITFSVLWFFLTLLPDSSFVPLEDVIFEHRLYLSMAGFSLFLVSAIYYIFQKKSSKAMVISLLIITAGYAMLTYKRNFVWQDELTLWNDVVHKSPNKARPYYNRGVVYWQQGKAQQAIADFSQAIERNPRNYAIAYYNRGVAYDEQGHIQLAIFDYTKAIEINPKLAEPLNNRGNAYKKIGNIPQAIADFDQAIAINPKLAEAYVSRGAVYAQLGNFTQAISDFSKSIEVNPGYVIAYTNRGNVYANQGNFARAINDFTKGITVDPGYVGNYIHRGNVYFQAQEYDKAWEDVRKAEELGYTAKPEFIAALKKASGIDR